MPSYEKILKQQWQALLSHVRFLMQDRPHQLVLNPMNNECMVSQETLTYPREVERVGNQFPI